MRLPCLAIAVVAIGCVTSFAFADEAEDAAYFVRGCEAVLKANPGKAHICPCQYGQLSAVLSRDALRLIAAGSLMNMGDAEALQQSHAPGWPEQVTAAYKAIYASTYLACDPIAAQP